MVALGKTGGRLITAEDHMVIGGAGSMLATALVSKGIAFKHRLLAVPGHFGQSAYTADELYDKHGIGAKAIAAAATTF